jgi:hypothetical protein
MRYFLGLIISLFLATISYSQISININLGSQPVWGPVGYDYVEYYYLPEVDTYYDVSRQRFYYYEKGNWLYRSTLPARYSHYNLYNTYKVVINEHQPWRKHKDHKIKYASYKSHNNQKAIRDSRDSKYYVIKKHPEHSSWIKKQEKDLNKNSSNNARKEKNSRNKNKK